MKHKLFTIYDSKAEAYLPPFTLPEEGMAVRAFANCANDPNHAFYKNPEDYNLFKIGQYDDSDAKITVNQTKKPLGCALEFKTENTRYSEFDSLSDEEKATFIVDWEKQNGNLEVVK